jgi:uncharacterized coiled-coil DUF342 family protein
MRRGWKLKLCCIISQMQHEMTREEKREIELEQFMRELVETIAKRFEEQKNSINFLKSVADDVKDEVASLRQEMLELSGRLSELNDSLTKLGERHNKLSRDIIGAILD